MSFSKLKSGEITLLTCEQKPVWQESERHLINNEIIQCCVYVKCVFVSWGWTHSYTHTFSFSKAARGTLQFPAACSHLLCHSASLVREISLLLLLFTSFIFCPWLSSTWVSMATVKQSIHTSTNFVWECLNVCRWLEWGFLCEPCFSATPSVSDFWALVGKWEYVQCFDAMYDQCDRVQPQGASTQAATGLYEALNTDKTQSLGQWPHWQLNYVAKHTHSHLY